MTNRFDGRIALIQRVKPNYRVPFFDQLADRCEKGFSLAAGQPLAVESIRDDADLTVGELFKTKNIHFKDPSNKLFACYQKGLIGWLERTDPDVLFVEANFRYLSSYAAIRWMKNKGRPVVGWGLGAKNLPMPLSAIRNNFLRGFDAMIAYSTLGMMEYQQVGFDANKCYMAKNAVLPAPTHAFEKDQVHTPIRVLFVGRLQRRKNVDKLIEAISSIPENTRPTLTVVGDGPEMESLRSQANSILPNTRFLGHLEGDALAEVFSDADLFVLPGTGGLAVQQAMSFGLPVIVEEGDGTQRDLVTDCNGWLIKESSVEALKGAIEKAIENPERLVAFGNSAYEVTKNEVNIQKMADIFVKVAKDVSK